MRCYENSGWLTSLTEFFGKGGEAGMGKFLLKFLVLVVIWALALSIKAY